MYLNRTTRTTNANVFAAARKTGCTARKVEGEWRITPPRGGEDSAYYTDDNADAVGTMYEIAKQYEYER